MSSEPPEESSESSTSATEQAKPRIKIGTQREGVAAPRVPPRVKTIFTTPDPADTSAAAPPETATAAANPHSDATTPAIPLESPSGLSLRVEDSLQAAPAAATAPIETPASSDAESVAESAPKPSPLAPTTRPSKFAVERPAGAKIPLPNLRAELPEDLAQEVEAALAGVTLNELTEAADEAKVGGELEPERACAGECSANTKTTCSSTWGGRNQGVVSLRQFAEPPEVGAVIEAVVTRFNADEGLYELSRVGAPSKVGDWSQVAEGMIVDATVTGHNKGGLECDVSKLRGFIPLSQIAPFRVEQPEQFVGQKLTCVVTEVDPERRKLVAEPPRDARARAGRSAAKAAGRAGPRPNPRRDRPQHSRFRGVRRSGGRRWLAPRRPDQLGGIKHPEDVLKLGQKIRVKIERINPENGKISLSHRDLLENPWTNVATKYPVTTCVKGTISKLMEFGAFVRLEPGVEGLIHISELAHGRVFRTSDVVAEGQEVEVKVLSVDPDAQRISLSLKALQGRPEPLKKANEPEEPEPPPLPPKKYKTPLKGGLGRSPGAEKFGLKW